MSWLNERRRSSTSQKFNVPPHYPGPGPLGMTDPNLWRLDSSDSGRHVWHYLGEGGGENELSGPCPFAKDSPQSFEAKHWLGLETRAPNLPDPNGDPLQVASNGFEYYKRMQSPDGHWSGEYGGPLFMIPGLVITSYVLNFPLPSEWKIEIARYLKHHQRNKGPMDNGWGLHIEGHSTVFGTACNYVVLRILGVRADEPMMVKARDTLHRLGGASAAPSWGKMWLSILNCYSWDGMNVTPAEMLIMPEWLPVHPSRYWIHMRSIYFPLSFLYGKRFQAKADSLILDLRKELYTQPYESIDWPKQRNNIAKADLYTPHPLLLDTLFACLSVYESYVVPCMPYFRQKGLERAYELCVMDDENTSFQCLAPVNKPLNMICRYIMEGPNSKAVAMHKEKFRDFMWLGKDGLMMCGTNGSQLWDCVFITQALVESGLAERSENHESVNKALEWLADCQIKENPPHLERAYRHPSRGAWPFSTREQGYTVSDCTAEGLKSVLMLQALSYTPKLVPEYRLQQAVDILLGMQNSNGGFASYELVRGTEYLELLNPAEVFGKIMVEYNYPECTTAALTALSLFTKQYPNYRKTEIDRARDGAVRYIHASQRTDGSWFGSWGICFTYATMFAIESLASVGETYSSSRRVARACEFLLKRQMADGGWGESFKSCESEQYVHNARSQLTNTSWAVIALCTAKYQDAEPIKKGMELIMSRQQRDGHWPRESVEGIFNKTCAISYPNFLFSWTIYALGKGQKYLQKLAP